MPAPKISPAAVLSILTDLGLISPASAGSPQSASWSAQVASLLSAGAQSLRSKVRRGQLPPGVWDALDTLESLLGQPAAKSPSAGGTSTAPPPSSPPGGFTSRPAPAQDPGISLTTRFPRKPPTLAEEASEWSDIFHTPTSSNVYSFQFHRRPGDATGTLYVTYKANAFHSGSLSTGRRRRGRRTGDTQLLGRAGKTVSGKENSPGSKYAYLNVPPSLFTKMKDAYSKGKFVWDELRIRGTIHGHRYRYVLAQGQLVGSEGRLYVPRKATKGGFVTRSVRTGTTTGRGGFQTSTLPPTASGGFTTRRVGR